MGLAVPGARLEEAVSLEHVREELAVQVDVVGRVGGVLLALQPVARDHRRADLAQRVRPDEDVPAGSSGGGVGPEVGPAEAGDSLRPGRR